MNANSIPLRIINWAIARQTPLLAFALVALTLFLFWPATGYELVDLDDLMYIHQNRIVLDGMTWPSIRMAFTEIWHGMWAPGLWVSYMLDVELFGLEAWGFHFTNLLLHALNAALVFTLFREWTQKPWRAFWAAAFWAWHPLRIESVAWVAERKDVLSGFFFLLCVGAYWIAQRGEAPDSGSSATGARRRRLFFGISVGGLALGLLVKPMLVTAPFILLLLDLWPLKRVRLDEPDWIRRIPKLVLEKWAFWTLSAGAAFMAANAHAMAGAVAELPWLARLKMIPLHYAFYLFKTVRPVNLTVLYEPMGFGRADFLVALLLLGGLTLWAWLGRKQNGNELVGWAWFLGLLVPVIGLVRFGAQSVADRFTYLPAIGISIALLHVLPGKKNAVWRWGRAILCGGILLWMAHSTGRQLPAWKNSTSLYDNLLRFFPSSPFGLHYRTMQQIRQGQAKDAEATIDAVIRNNPDVELYRYGKTMAMGAQGAAAEAKEWLEARPPPAQSSILGYWEWHLGMLSFQLGQLDETLRYVEEAMRKMPVNDTSRNDLVLLGMAAGFEKGDATGALAWAHQWNPYRMKTRIDLLDLMPYYLTQWNAGNRMQAMAYFRRLLQASPDNVEWMNNLAWVMATASWGGPADPQEILAYAKRANEHGGNHPVLLDTLGAALANAGDFAAARECAEKALALARDPLRGPAEFDRNIEKRLRQYQREEPWREEDAAGRLLRSFYDR